MAKLTTTPTRPEITKHHEIGRAVNMSTSRPHILMGEQYYEMKKDVLTPEPALFRLLATRLFIVENLMSYQR